MPLGSRLAAWKDVGDETSDGRREVPATLASLLGPQYPDDDAFAARMRGHQSWYRAAVLAEPYGVA